MALGGVVVSCVLGGCFPEHVDLAPLPPSMTPEQRLAAFAYLRATAREETVTCQGFSCSDPSNTGVVLGSGQMVQQAGDLLPVLAPDSAAAEEARGARSSEDRRKWWYLAGAVTLFGGGYWLSHTSNSDTGDFSTAAAVFTLGGTLAVILGFTVDRHIGREHANYAFKLYGTAIARRLAICADGLNIVPCEYVGATAPSTTSAPGAPTVPAIRDPALDSLRQR